MKSFFRGRWRICGTASAAVKVPCLRKDFIVDEFQLLEARAHSADAVLLIVAALTQTELTALALGARSRGLDVLCEVHDEAELQRALDAGCDLIGVNTRDLRTFKVDPETAFRLAEQLPKNVVRVAESGIRSGEDIARLRDGGVSGVFDWGDADAGGAAGRGAAGVGCEWHRVAVNWSRANSKFPLA